MRDWEFLLQKEGDRSWLPLESPTVEILEGRYRVVAQSRRENSTVEIRVVHHSAQDDPSKRRLQIRSSQTNDRGLIVVMPYTHLQPGLWELRCQGDLMADMLGEGWQAAVQLQVLPQEAEWEDWPEAIAPQPITVPPSVPAEPEVAPATAAQTATIAEALDSQSAEIAVQLPAAEFATVSRSAPPEATVSPTVSPLTLPDPKAYSASDRGWEEAGAEPLRSDQVAQTLMQDLDRVADPVWGDTSLTEPAAPEITAPEITTHEEVFQANPAQGDHPSVNLVLEQTSFVARQGQLLLLRGRIESPVPMANTTGFTLEVKLRNPQHSRTLAELREPLPPQSLPLPFECAIEIPTGEQTHLLLGELTLWAEDEAIAANSSFTVTTAIEQLLATLASDVPDTDWLQPPLQFAEPAPPPDLNLALLNLVGTPKTQPQFQPSSSPPLPPQLLQPEPSRAPKPLQLPFANRNRPSAPPEAETGPTAEPEAEIEVGVAERSSTPPAPMPESVVEPSTEAAVSPASTETIDMSADLPLELLMPSEPIRSQLAPPTTSEDAAFRSLNLQKRFWSRLNALATDAELSGWLSDAPPPESPELAGSSQPAALSGADAKLAAQEIVVEDEYPTHRSTQPLEPPDSMVVSEDEPIPTPELDVPFEELVAGTSVQVRVKLPNLMPRIYVKLWLRDPQSRSLLDGPRWLADFIPDGRGRLEARLALTVPYGCVDLQFEAIAVEMATQRESHKATVSRQVVPPDFPLMSIDNFDL